MPQRQNAESTTRRGGQGRVSGCGLMSASDQAGVLAACHEVDGSAGERGRVSGATSRFRSRGGGRVSYTTRRWRSVWGGGRVSGVTS
jgi:hypothetical protein